MFVVYCPRHQARVLLSPDDITLVVSTVDGVELHWCCTCGESGVQCLRRPPGPDRAPVDEDIRRSA
jgi:hypothetical protein